MLLIDAHSHHAALGIKGDCRPGSHQIEFAVSPGPPKCQGVATQERVLIGMTLANGNVSIRFQRDGGFFIESMTFPGQYSWQIHHHMLVLEFLRNHALGDLIRQCDARQTEGERDIDREIEREREIEIEIEIERKIGGCKFMEDWGWCQPA
jgi:hypothetical protein